MGSFSVTQLGDKADKVGKDTNFRGLTIFNNVVYYTKGSGGNGVNTVYFIDTTGSRPARARTAPGFSVPGASLPASALAFDPSLAADPGRHPYNMCVLQGFPTALKSTTVVHAGDAARADPALRRLSLRCGPATVLARSLGRLPAAAGPAPQIP